MFFPILSSALGYARPFLTKTKVTIKVQGFTGMYNTRLLAPLEQCAGTAVRLQALNKSATSSATYRNLGTVRGSTAVVHLLRSRYRALYMGTPRVHP